MKTTTYKSTNIQRNKRHMDKLQGANADYNMKIRYAKILYKVF